MTNNNIITLEELDAKTLYVIKYITGYREVGTMKDVRKAIAQDDGNRDFEIKDIDFLIAEQQPEEIRDFWLAFEAYRDESKNYGIEWGDFYKDIYLVDVQSEKKTKRVWTEEEIKTLVQTNDKVLYGALKNLYDCQTADEKTSEKTSHANGAGFNAMDAKVLTSIAEFLLKNGFLTEKQKELVRKKLVKYNRQLTRLANA